MDGTGSDELDVRQRQLRYEERIEQIRQHIDGLLNDCNDLGNALPDLQPRIDDDYYRLDQLDDQARNNITQLLPLITRYEQAVAEWDRWDANFYVRTEDTPWTRKVYRIRTLFFRDESRNPPLPDLVQQLIDDYNNTVRAIRICREALDARATAQAALNAIQSPRSHSTVESPPASTTGSEAAHSAASETPIVQSPISEGSVAAHSAATDNPLKIVRFAETPHSGDSATPLQVATDAAPTTTATTPSLLTFLQPWQKLMRNLAQQYADHMHLHSKPARSAPVSTVSHIRDITSSPSQDSTPASSHPSSGLSSNSSMQRPIPKPRTVPSPIEQQRPTPTPAPRQRRSLFNDVPSTRPVTQLDHGDNSTASPASVYGRRDDFGTWYPDDDLPPEGLMSYADGDIRDTRPATWDNSSGPFRLYTDFNAPNGHTTRTDAVPGGPMPHSGYGTTAEAHTRAPPGGPMPHSGYGAPGFTGAFQLRMPPPATNRGAAQTHTASDHARTMNNTTFRAAGRGSHDAVFNGTPPLSTPPLSDQPASTNAATVSSTDRQSTSSFYRAGKGNLKLSPAIAPPQLVLKEMPIEPFEGDVRKFPSFRMRFLEIMQSYAGLEPRHRFQYLLQYLKGTPRNLVDSFPLSDEYYWIAIDLLEERYGDKHRIQKLLRNDILGLATPSMRVADLQLFHDTAFKAMQILLQVDFDVDGQNALGESLLSKLPNAVRLEIIRHPKYTKSQPMSVILTALRQYLNTMTEVEESGLTQITVTTRGSATPGHPKRSGSGQPAHQAGTSNNQYTFAADTDDVCAAPREKRTVNCAYCSRPHFALRCSVYHTISMRLERIRQLGHCLLCLRGGHWSNACPFKRNATCGDCDNKRAHHISLCRVAVQRWLAGRSSTAPVSQQPGPHGGSEASRTNQKKTVNWSGVPVEDPTANNMRRSSAPSSPKDNSNDRRTRQSRNNKNKGHRSSGRGGAPRPTTASAAESTTQQDVKACDGPGLLPGHQSLLQTDRCSNPTENPQPDPTRGDGYDETVEQAWLAELRGQEESPPLPESVGHLSDAEIDDPGAEYDNDGWYPDQDGFAVSTSSPADTQAVILECVKTTAINPRTGASQEIVAFFDSGSTASYVSANLARALDLPQYEKQQWQVNTFAATTPTKFEGFKTSLLLRPHQGRHGKYRRRRTIALAATAADNIVHSVRTAFVTDKELPALRQSRCALISTRETPDLLIGQNDVHLFNRGKPKNLPNGCYVVTTALGPVVGGAGKVTTNVPRDVSNSNVADTGSEAGTLCRPGSGAPIDILDRSTSGPIRESQTTSSTNGTRQSQTTASAPAHSAGTDVALNRFSGPQPEETVSSYLCGMVEKSDAELLGDFSYLENAGIGTTEMKPDDQAAADMLKNMHQRESDGRYKVPLLFRTATGTPPSNEELPTNAALAKGRAISTRNSLLKAPERLKTYDGIVKDYEARQFIGKAPRFTPYPKHCLSHHPVFKETSTTTATRPVFDASAKLPGRSCLNDWVFRGPVLLPVVPAILLRSRFPIIIIVCDIGKAFLQMSVMESHRDCLRFYWFKDPFAEPTADNLIEYRFNRVPFGLKSSPYLLAGVIKMHLEQEGTPLALEMLKNCYVDNVLLMADNVNEALQKYRDSKATFAKIQMPLREYASNNAQFNDAVDPADRAELDKLRELGIRWDITADYWDLPLMPKPASLPAHSVGRDATAAATEASGVPAHSAGTPGPVPSNKAKRKRGKKSDDGRLTKRSMLRLIAQIFDPLGLVQAATLLAKLVIQEVWKVEKDWDDDVPAQLAQLWDEAIKDFDKTIIRIPRRIAKGKISSAEIHVFTDGSSQAYGFTAYLRVPEADGSYSTNLVYSRAKVKPIKDTEKYTIPRMELLGVLVGARAAKFLYQEVSVDITAVYLWSDSTIVLHQVADNEKIKEVFVENRLKEIRQIRDQLEIQFRHVPTDDNPADIVSRGIAAAELQHCSKWWFGASFLAYDECHWPKQPSSLGEGTHSVPSPKEGLELYGSDTFAALYADSFTPPELVTNRRFRPRKKKNPLDNITKPLPPTTVSAFVVDAMGKATHSVARPNKLPSTSVLPADVEDKYPVWSRQVRITYYVVRFAAACLRRLRRNRHDKEPRPPSPLGFDIAEHFKSPKPNLRDLSLTETIILRKTQLRHPPSLHDRRNLGIFEHQGMLYVKGRLGNMKLRPTALTPLYLPREAKETELLIMDYHRSHCHSGVTATLANIRMRYWFTRGRHTIQRAICKNCFPCRRETLHPYASPPWPQLPAARVTRARPFLCTGLDFFGPCYLRTPQADGTFQVQKHYVAIFVCMTYRCVHLELCADLSTQEFLHALRRFGSRREFPERVLSDNGQSFLTAREVIQQVHQATAPPRPYKRRNPVRQVVSARLAARRTPAHSASGLHSTTPPPLHSKSKPGSAHSADPGNASATNPLLTPEEEQLIDFCQRHKIEWQTITELSPWKGGVYERLIGLIKHCLRRSIGRTKPTVVEFSSLLAETERTANSRPLSYIADSETDFFLVRPLDFIHPLLRDEALQAPLDPPVDAEADPNDPDFIAPGKNQLHGKIIKDLKRARLQADLFWAQFRDGYLAELRSRGVTSKRPQFGEPDIHPGDLVLVWEPNVPRCFWRFALVLEVLPCEDGEVRSARVRFSKTHQEHTRSLSHLYPIGNLPRVPAQTTSSADVYLSSIISDTPFAMGNTLYTASTSTAEHDDKPPELSAHANEDAPVAEPTAETTNSQASADPAHSAGAAELATEPATTEGTPSPPSEPSTSPNRDDRAPQADTTLLQRVTDLMTLANNQTSDVTRIGSVIAAGIQALEQTDDEEVQRLIVNDVNAAVRTISAQAGPRADLGDQEKKNNTKPNTRIGARGAFQNRSATAAPAHSARAATPQTTQQSAPPTSSTPTDVWNEISTANAAAAKARQPTTAGRGARRGRGAFGTGIVTVLREAARQSAMQPQPAAPTATTSDAAAADPWNAPDPEPWGSTENTQPFPVSRGAAVAQPQAAVLAHSAGTAAPSQIEQAAPTHSVGAATQPQAPTAPTATQQNSSSPELLPTESVLDLQKLPAYPSLATIKREVLQFFSFETGAEGQQLAKVDDDKLASHPKRKPQDIGFWIQFANRQHGTTHWDPVKLCYGRDEDRTHFHQSIRVHRLIVKTTWTKFRFIAARQDLLYMLDQVLNLRVLCFGQMILLEYAVRLQGEHDRMGTILQFLYDMLRATDFEHDIPRIINRYHATMTRGMDPKTTDPKKSPFPTEVDLKNAAEHWLCYCHRAFIYFLTHLSGSIHWNVEWLQSKELNRDFRRAVSDNILMKAHNVFQDLRRRVYQQYVLRRIHALETGDTTYGWTRLPDARKAAESDPSGRFKINTTIIGKTVIFMADEIFNSAFVKTMKKEDILLNWMPSTNREDVLYSVRKFIPGPMTERVIFWFGQTYIFNGNEDYGQLVSELCYHYTTHFGLIDQCVILPAYDRTHRQIWTQEVLCLFLQRRLAVPHAQVVLHPYDLRLWQVDQPAAERGGTPPPWTNRHQSEDGFIYKLGAIEARKENIRTHHGLDLWTWYMRDNPGLPPPPELYEQRAAPDFRPRGNALAAQLAAREEQSSSGTAVAHSAAAVTQPNEPRNAPMPAAVQPTPSATTSSLATTDIVTELITRILSGPLLQTIVVDATQQAVRQVSTEIDAKLERIEALLRRRASQQSNATAEHRHPGAGSDA